MSNQKLLKDQRLTSIRIDKPLKDELERVAEILGIPKSEIVRCGIQLMIRKPSKVEQIIKGSQNEIDEWYRNKEKEAQNNGEKEG